MKKFKLINTAGQITAVITDKISSSDLSQIAKSIMDNNPIVEQVGYLDGRNFRMMGGELSINGLIAGAYLIRSSGKINEFNFEISGDTLTLSLPRSLLISVTRDVVKLQGITYKLIPSLPSSRLVSPNTKMILQALAQETAASGIIYYQESEIKPLIYVPATDTLVWENACGSGSLATALITNQSVITQPSGQTIGFQFTNKNIVVTTTAKEV